MSRNHITQLHASRWALVRRAVFSARRLALHVLRTRRRA